jgi:CRISPR-associated protein Cas1
VPTVRDRVVERAVLAALTPVIDPWLGPWSFAYRPGLGVSDAVQELARLREQGLTWVARADVADCFPSIPMGHLRRLISVFVADEGLRALVEAFLARRSTGEGGVRAVPGLPQGSPLSPLWSNLVLTRLDERLADAGFPVVRYSDDFAVLAASREDAWEGMRVASDAVGELGMRLGADKSEVMSFDEGFTFLGEDFGPRYPPALDDHRAVEPPRRVVYVGRQGSRVRVEAGRLVIESPDDQELLDVPSGQVERLVCFGAVGVSAGFRSWALANGVDQVSCPAAALTSATPGAVATARVWLDSGRSWPPARTSGGASGSGGCGGGEGRQADRGAAPARPPPQRRNSRHGHRRDGAAAGHGAGLFGPGRADGGGGRRGAGVLWRPRRDHA